MNDTITNIFNEENNVQQEILPIEQMLDTTEKKPRKKDKILIIQIVLLLLWVILTLVIYFFGYDFIEPFIKV